MNSGELEGFLLFCLLSLPLPLSHKGSSQSPCGAEVLTCPVQCLLGGLLGTGNARPPHSRAQIVHRLLFSSLCCLFFFPKRLFLTDFLPPLAVSCQKENSLFLSPPCGSGNFSAARPRSYLGSSKELSQQNPSKHQWNIVLSSWANGLAKIKPLSGGNALLSLVCAWCWIQREEVQGESAAAAAAANFFDYSFSRGFSERCALPLSCGCAKGLDGLTNPPARPPLSRHFWAWQACKYQKVLSISHRWWCEGWRAMSTARSERALQLWSDTSSWK